MLEDEAQELARRSGSLLGCRIASSVVADLTRSFAAPIRPLNPRLDTGFALSVLAIVALPRLFSPFFERWNDKGGQIARCLEDVQPRGASRKLSFRLSRIC